MGIIWGVFCECCLALLAFLSPVTSLLSPLSGSPPPPPRHFLSVLCWQLGALDWLFGQEPFSLCSLLLPTPFCTPPSWAGVA